MRPSFDLSRRWVLMPDFAKLTVLEALDESLAAATHLEPKHAATVAAARALAAKIDAWDVIVQWALEDQAETEAKRPAVPANDNTSLPSFLNYMKLLGLTVPEVKAAPVAASKAAAEPEAKESTPEGGGTVTDMTERVRKRMAGA